MTDTTDINRIFNLSEKEEEDVLKMAAVGLMPSEIAAAMEWPVERQVQFCFLAQFKESQIGLLIAAGKATGRIQPQIKLQEAATAGNLDAVKTLIKVQAGNRFNELVTYMDDDETTRFTRFED